MIFELAEQRERIEGLLAEATSGSEAARNELAALSYHSLIHQVEVRLRCFAQLQRHFPPEEVAHNVIIRMRTALRNVKPQTLEHLIRLANQHLTWALKDLVQEINDYSAALQSPSGRDSEREAAELDPVDPASLENLEEYIDFHGAALVLQGPEGKTFRMRYYEGLPVKEIAAQLGVTPRTVQDYWKRALIQIRRFLTGE